MSAESSTESSTELIAENVRWNAQARSILQDVSIAAPAGRITGLIGPNGSGKSSLLRCLAGLRPPTGGRVLVEGKELADISRRDLARRLAVVEQEASTDVDLLAREVVELGRTPHRDRWGSVMSSYDAAVVEEAMRRTDVLDVQARRWAAMSGGERQRVQIARALAQEPAYLLLDEPTNHLDVRHQFELFALLRNLPATIIVALHDLPTAARSCDHLVILHNGCVVASGAPHHVLTPTLVADVFGVDVQIQPRSDGRADLTYLGLSAAR